MKPSRLIPPADRERIEAAVREAERGTSGEIVVSVVRSCDRHVAAAWRMTAWLGVALLLVLEWLTPGISPLLVAGALVVVGVVAHVACLEDSVRRFFVTEVERQCVAEREALRAFGEHGLRRTAGRTGVLIFVALLEHRVVVLGDEAIDRALGEDESWQAVVDFILAGIRAGRPTEGILDAVRTCGAMLEHPLPAEPSELDEIPHGLILED